MFHVDFFRQSQYSVICVFLVRGLDILQSTPHILLTGWHHITLHCVYFVPVWTILMQIMLKEPLASSGTWSVGRGAAGGGASTRRVCVNPTCQRNETLKNGTGSDKPMDHSLVAPMMTLSQLCIYLHNERLPTLNTALCIIPLMRPFFSVNIGFNLSYCTVEYTLFI